MKAMLEKLMKSKKASKMNDVEKDAKVSSLEKMKQAMEDMMGDKLRDGMKKVTVAADDEQGLKEGLQKAKDLIANGQHDESDDESPEEASQEEASLNDMHGSKDDIVKRLLSLKEEEHSENEPDEEDKINQKLKKLMKL